MSRRLIRFAGSTGVGAGLRLAVLLLLLGATAPVHAQAVDCSDFPNSTLDGFVNPNPPDNITIDQNCTVKNFPADNPLTTNFSFNTLTPGQTDIRWLMGRPTYVG
jgi:hypothetical protein